MTFQSVVTAPPPNGAVIVRFGGWKPWTRFYQEVFASDFPGVLLAT
jgi:hypothetical protein